MRTRVRGQDRTFGNFLRKQPLPPTYIQQIVVGETAMLRSKNLEASIFRRQPVSDSIRGDAVRRSDDAQLPDLTISADATGGLPEG
jgi:hypothetical protein